MTKVEKLGTLDHPFSFRIITGSGTRNYDAYECRHCGRLQLFRTRETKGASIVFKIIDMTRILMNKSKSIAIATMDNIDFSDFKTLRWNEFIDLTLSNELRTKKRRFNTTSLKEVKKLLDNFSFDTGDIFVHYDEEQNPLIFELDDNYVILMAQYGAPIKIGDAT